MGKNGLDNINIEAYKAAMQGAKDLIKADKDIISQIKVECDEDNDETRLYFPKGIVPTKVYFDYMGEDLYCDYDSLTLVNIEGLEFGTITPGQNILLILDGYYGDFTFTNLDFIMYVNYAGSLDSTITGNWYKILNPQSGTKLYRHRVTIIKGFHQSEPLYLEIVSKNQESYENDRPVQTTIIKEDLVNIINCKITNVSRTQFGPAWFDTLFTGDFYVIYPILDDTPPDFGSMIIDSGSEEIIDTVTEL